MTPASIAVVVEIVTGSVTSAAPPCNCGSTVADDANATKGRLGTEMPTSPVLSTVLTTVGPGRFVPGEWVV